ncbi:MAG: nucleotidyltransferase family protein [Candidatus Marinimicrobia bacterium]|nr:nucleotidyltransferase family protein [Candidatus Neomarinimicrobiota bacterium]
MKAMLFAAGKGTRLKPLTDRHPKCLVTADNITLLEHNIQHLIKNGVTTIVINTHHYGQQIIDFVHEHNFGIDIHISEEAELMETGGGLLLAQDHFRDEEAFIVCNSDIYTDLDLRTMVISHLESKNLATLAVADRKTSRYLRFNSAGLLCGWENRKTSEEISWNDGEYQTKAFNGIQVMSPAIFDYMPDFGAAFSTIPIYLKAAQAGEKIAMHPMDDAYWIDIGTIEKLEELRKHLAKASSSRRVHNKGL